MICNTAHNYLKQPEILKGRIPQYKQYDEISDGRQISIVSWYISSYCLTLKSITCQYSNNNWLTNTYKYFCAGVHVIPTMAWRSVITTLDFPCENKLCTNWSSSVKLSFIFWTGGGKAHAKNRQGNSRSEFVQISIKQKSLILGFSVLASRSRERCISHGSLLAVFQRVQFAPSHVLLASTASTAARTVPVVMVECATTSRGSASAQLASVDAGTQPTPLADRLLNYYDKSLLWSANFCTPTLKIGQTMAWFIDISI